MCFVIVPIFLTAQPRQNFILSEINFLKERGGYELNYSFRIPYERLVFQKDHDGYITSFRLNIEVMDSTGKFLTRGVTTKKIVAYSYDETISRDLFAEGLIKLNVTQTHLTILPVFTDVVTNQELKTQPILPNKLKDESSFLSPLVIQSNRIDCNNSKKMKLVNYGGSVPFDNKSFDLIIPTYDTSASFVKCVMINNADTVFNSILTDGTISGLEIIECDGSIYLNEFGEKLKFYTFKNFNSNLEEGNLIIQLSSNDSSNDKYVFSKRVKWFNKPFILEHQEISSRVLKYIEDDDTVSELLRADEDKFMNKLLKVWQKYDPTEQTKYNELMEQFYIRVDYSLMNFSTITGKAGWETDRGEVYIKYGSPGEIKRSSDDKGKVVETWIYKDANTQFSFIDKTGTGEFVFVSQK